MACVFITVHDKDSLVSYTDKENEKLTEDALLFAEINYIYIYNSAFSFDFITIGIINRSR